MNKGQGLLAFGAMIFAILIAFGMGVGLTYSYKPHEERYQTYRYASDEPVQLERATAGQTDTKTLEYRTPCREPKGREESELCAQWRATKAGEQSALWAKWGVWVTGIGICGLIFTIAQGRIALKRARAANKIARKTAKRELRAYVSGRPDFMFSFDRTIRPRAKIKMINHGQTPAYNLISAGQIVLVAKPFEETTALPEFQRKFGSPAVLFPGADLDMTVVSERCFSEVEISSFLNEASVIVVYGEIHYSDCFDRKQQTTFCSYIDPPSDERGKLASNASETFDLSFTIAPIYNDAT